MNEFANIFKAYDIRGLVDVEIDVDFTFATGVAFARFLQIEREPGTIVIGEDMRLSSSPLADAFSAGVNSQGMDVVRIGLASTDMLYFASGKLGLPGAMFTASHNPAEYNGIKLCFSGARPIGKESGLVRIEDFVREGSPIALRNVGVEKQRNMLEEYVDYLLTLVDLKSIHPLKIIVDAGNGMAGFTAPAVMERLNIDLIPMYFELDGNFPNHEANPIEAKNLKDLQKRVKKEKADIGLAFDGDADRLGVVTKDGQVIFPDRQMMLFAKDVLSRHPKGQIIYDVKCTRNLAPWIEQHGGQALMWKTGHSLVKAKLKETGAPLAGEMSGHIFFKDRWFGFDDGLYTGARLLEILSKVANPSEVLNALPNAICTPELQLPCAEGESFLLLEKIKANPQFPSSQSINTIDGVRVEYADGFGLARPSNTTPIVVLRFEADSDEAIKRIQGEFKKALLAVKPDAKLPF